MRPIKHASFLQQAQGQDHVDFEVGTVDFWSQPSYAPADDRIHMLMTAVAPISAGNATAGFRFRKADDSNKNHLQFIVVDALGFVAGSGDTPFTPGTWVRVTVTWDFATSGQQVRIYFDGTEAVYPDGTGPNDNGSGIIADTTPMLPPPSPNADIVIGDPQGGQGPASGLIDDFKIYGTVVAP